MVELLPGERLDTINEKLSLIQKKDGLMFGTDAYLLAAYAKDGRSMRAAELGAGTGVVSLLMLAKDKAETVYEIADLMYHVMVLMVEMGISVEDIKTELASRHVIDHKVKQEKMTK